MISLDEQDMEDWLFWKHETETDVPGGGADEVSNPMLSLPVVAIADLTSPSELFRCIFYTTTLSAGSCIARQGVRRTFRGGTAQGKQYKKEFVPKIYEYCASGKCMQGADVRVALPDHKPPATEAERTKVRNRALGAQNLKSIEEKLASAEPPVAADLERDAKVEAENKSWRQFQEEKERRRAAEEAAAPAKPEHEPHPLSRRGMLEAAEPEPRPPSICKADGCSTALRVNNLTGLCRLHRNKVTSREREKLVPVVARAAGTAGNVLEGDAVEKPDLKQGQKRCACGRKIRRGRDGVTHEKCMRCRALAAGRQRNGAPAANDPPPRRKILGRRARAAQRAANGAPAPAQAKVYPGLLQAQPDDLFALLESRRAHHLAEAERCDRALKALRA